MFDRIRRREFFKFLLSLTLPILSGCLSSVKRLLPLRDDNKERLYKPSWTSLDEHPVPDWYENAKLGIFVHWYPAAVPAYGNGWYAYYMHVGKSDVNEYHKSHYGDPLKFEYKDFIRQTNLSDNPENFTADRWDPNRWANFFSVVGARYVVATAEHHDGFPMWDAKYTPWTARKKGPKTDVIGRLASAVREKGMKFGGSNHRMTCHYDPRYRGLYGHPGFGPDGPEKSFVKEWKSTVYNMINHHKPDILWLDGDWTAPAEFWGTKALVSWYYNKAQQDWDKDVLVNDRLGGVRFEHGDVFTPENTHYDYIVKHKWESVRPLGDSWTYNRKESSNDLLSARELIQLLSDVVSKNGNLLIGVGPKKNGLIPGIQKNPLEELGRWLDLYGEAIYGTTYWVSSEDNVSDVEVRYTMDDNYLYCILFDWPKNRLQLEVRRFIEIVPEQHTIELLGEGDMYPVELEWEQEENSIYVDTRNMKPNGFHTDHAYVLRIQLPPMEEREISRFPDLAFVDPDITVNRTDEDDVRLEVNVRNEGVVESKKTTLSFVDVTGDTDKQKIISEKDIPSLRNNESVTISTKLDISGFQDGNDLTLKAIIDPEDNLDELSKRNNSITSRVKPPD